MPKRNSMLSAKQNFCFPLGYSGHLAPASAVAPAAESFAPSILCTDTSPGTSITLLPIWHNSPPPGSLCPLPRNSNAGSTIQAFVLSENPIYTVTEQ